MIEDFLSFVDENFPHLNPYDNFHQCKANPELIRRRIFNLLKSIALDENKVKSVTIRVGDIIWRRHILKSNKSG